MGRLTSLFPDGRPAVVAHRGASRAARENTVEAFTIAAAMTADAVELDARRTGDGAVVVHHDPVVADVGAIVEITSSELRLRAPWIPTLAEALEACGALWVNVEIKNLPTDPDWDPDESLAAAVIGIVEAQGRGDRVVVSSFNPHALARVRDESGLPTALLCVPSAEPVSALAIAADAGHAAFHPGYQALAGDLAARVTAAARELDVAVIPWTVDDEAEIARLVAAGVDGIITNVPDVARRVVG